MKIESAVIHRIFDDWMAKQLKPEFAIGDPRIYQQPRKKYADNTINRYLKSEADIAVHLGAWLHGAIRDWAVHNLIMHSEMNVYPQSNLLRADLSIHQLPSSDIWDVRGEFTVIESARVVIEIKYVTSGDPAYGLGVKKGARGDILKMQALDDSIMRFILVLVEAGEIPVDFEQEAAKVREEAAGAGIGILSNARHLRDRLAA